MTGEDRRLVLATRNPHKVAELRDILHDVLTSTGLELVGLDAFPDLEGVVEAHERELRRGRPDERQVVREQRAAEAGVGGT